MNPISASTPPYTISALPSTSPTILPTCLSLFDESIAWLTSKGLSAQWGSEPLQDDEKTIAKMKRIIEVGVIRLYFPGNCGLSHICESVLKGQVSIICLARSAKNFVY